MGRCLADHIRRLPLAHDLARGQDALSHLGPLPAPVGQLIQGAAGSSPYLHGLILHEAEWLAPRLDRVPDPDELLTGLLEGFDGLTGDALGPDLRIARRRLSLLAGLADLGGVWSLEDVTAALTRFADRAVDLAFRAHLARETERGRIPEHEADAGSLILLAMGKMGAHELNYSSDIDLIVLFDDEAYAPDDRMAARAGLIRVTRQAAATLSDITELGHVFRTDLRLRPDASVTPVCISAAAALSYYESEGRTWERGAYIKARPCAGNLDAGARFLQALRPFVWRRHLDYAAIEDAHSMRQRIRAHRGLGGAITVPGHDIKLGRGGIREIEFFTQTHQLISGGRDPSLRQRGTVAGLEALAAAGWVGADDAAALIGHYRQHREVEHRLQMINDAQTHEIPLPGPALDQVARLSGAADTEEWAATIGQRLFEVERLSDSFFSPSEADDLPDLPQDQAALVESWRTYPALRSARARRLFRRIKADLLHQLGRAANPGEALARFDGFLRGLPAGAQLFALFEANPQLIDLIVDICATAPRLAAYLSQHSEVLDAVIAGRFFAPWPGKAALVDQLGAALAAASSGPEGGYERALDAARRFAHEWQFRIGVHHLRGLMDAHDAAAHYTDIAEAVITSLTPLVEAEFSRRHGPPPGRGAVILGMGSLGPRRLHAVSDLDLIVIYDADGAEASVGPRPLAARSYYARLTQAVITALSVPTAGGPLYKVDMRLRPSGRQGPLATALGAFRHYQLHEAWAWEHLALTSANVVASLGVKGAELAVEVETLRQSILAETGSNAAILPELAAMRQRIFEEKPADGRWEARSGRGRLQDITLLAQSCALRAGSASRDTVAQLEKGAQKGLLDEESADRLGQIYAFLWQLEAARRLLTELPLDMEHLGEGGRAFLLRETGADNPDALAAQLRQVTETAGSVIDAAIDGRQPCRQV